MERCYNKRERERDNIYGLFYYAKDIGSGPLDEMLGELR